MHEKFAQVLSNKDLSKAGELFAVQDKDIENDLSIFIQRVQEISSSPDYLVNDNDQSVVEICVTRITLAIRETGTIEKHATSLVHLLDSCLKHDLKASPKDEDPPHAKIASDLMSCIFLNYNRKSVMELVIPVAVKFLHQGNQELSRNMSSYLSLAAIENTQLLASHMQPLLESILNGNRSLIKVLPQIYAANKTVIHDHIPDLVLLLADSEVGEKNNLLQLFGLVAKQKPMMLERHLPVLCDYLSSTTTSMMVLQAFVDMATAKAEPFLGHMTRLKLTAEQQPSTLSMVAKVMAAVGKTSKDRAKESCSYLVSQLPNTDSQMLPLVLNEIKAIVAHYPSLLPEYMSEITKYSQSASTAARIVVQQLKDLQAKGITEKDRKTAWSQTEGSVTVITVGNPSRQDLRTSSASVTAVATMTSIHMDKLQLSNLKTVATSTRDIHVYVPTSRTISPQPSTSQLAHHGGGVSAPVGYPQGQVQAVVVSNVNKTRSSTFVESRHSMEALGGSGVTSLTSSSGTSTDERLIATPKGSAATLSSNYMGQPHAIPFRDAVQQFCDKHLSKIKTYVNHIQAKVPIPIKIGLEEGKHKSYCRINFICFGQSENCLYGQHFFSYRTKLPRLWIHLLFLALQGRSRNAVCQADPSVAILKVCWDQTRTDSGNSFVRLVTSSFPSSKDQDAVLHELHSQRFFDLFEYNHQHKYWACFLCNHPEKASGILQDGNPVIEGQLKEKKGRWKFFKRWKTRYFTLSGATLTSNKKDSKKETLPVSKIQSVKAVKRSGRDLPKAFEIFTNDQKYVLKTKDGPNAEQWVQAIQVALVRSQNRAGTKFSPDDPEVASVRSKGKGKDALHNIPKTRL